jgi:hypothetical protein
VRVAYAGHEALTFSDYIDLEQGRTLYAEPGRVYDIMPASGRVVPEVPEPWFVPVEGEPAAVAWPAEPDAVPDPEPVPETGQEPAEG